MTARIRLKKTTNGWKNYCLNVTYATCRGRKMKTYRVSWRKGRRIGAIGIDYPDSVIVQANSPYDAHMKAYDTHEHLMFVDVTEMDESDV